MSTKEKETVVTTVEPITEPTVHTAAAQARLQELRSMRDLIPLFAIPMSAKDTARLRPAARVPAELVELAAVALTNEKSLVRGDAATPAELRDLVSLAEAYGPFADELEAFAQFIRHTVTAARNRAGRHALTVYALVRRLSKQPETAHLAPYVENMRRALGRSPRLTPEAVARREAAKAAKAAAAKSTTQSPTS